MKVPNRAILLLAALTTAVAASACDNSVVAPAIHFPAQSNVPAQTALAAVPSSIALTGTGQSQSFNLSKGSNVSATSSNTAVATVKPGTAANSFVVTAVAAGSAKIALSAPGFAPANVPVTVSVTNLGPQ